MNVFKYVHTYIATYVHMYVDDEKQNRKIVKIYPEKNTGQLHIQEAYRLSIICLTKII